MAQEPFTGDLKLVVDGMDVKTIPKLENHHANKLPRLLLENIRPKSIVQHYGDITIWTVKDLSLFNDVDRTVQWVTKGSQAAFLQIQSKPSVRKLEGDQKAVDYDAKVHEHDTSFSTTVGTRQCFVEVIDQYRCSIRVGLPDLRNFLSARLRAYPVYATEIVRLLNDLYTEAHISKEVDPALATFLINRIKTLRPLLIEHRGLQTFLHDRLDGKQKIKALIPLSDLRDEDITRILRRSGNGIRASTETTALLSEFLETHLSTSTHNPTPKPPTNPPPPKHSLQADLIHTLYASGRIYIAKQSSTNGTLLLDSAGKPCTDPRNRAFNFSRGDLLVEISQEGLVEARRPDLMVLQNSRREVGEVAAWKGMLVEAKRWAGENGKF